MGWFISLFIYFGCFMWLFDLDLQETMICVAIIWLVRTWGSMFLLGMLFGAL